MDARTDGVTVDVAVVGAGLAGLAAAATAASAGRSVLLLDGQPGGGRAATDQVGRYRFNRGAHALATTGAGHQVLRDLGVRVVGSPPPLRGSRARLGDRIGLAPTGAASLARTDLLTPREKLVLGRVLAGVRRWRPDDLAGRTADGWFDDLGLEGTARHVMEMVSRLATYAADLDVVGADVVAAQVRTALAGVEYLHGGWSTLVEGLTAACWDRGAQLAPSPGAPLGSAAAAVATPDGRPTISAADGAGGGQAGGSTGRVRGVVPDGGRVRVELEDGVVLARRVVVAAGSQIGRAHV